MRENAPVARARPNRAYASVLPMPSIPQPSRSDPDPPGSSAGESAPRPVASMPGTAPGSASGELFQLLYAELRALAQRQLANERAGHTLNATALVHEAFARLGGSDRSAWTSRAHFCAVAARAMRRILVDHARARRTLKRGGGAVRADLTLVAAPEERSPVDVLALDEALGRLADIEPAAAQVVEMQFFAGIDQRAIAEAMGITDRTVRRHWTFAKAWLHRELSRASGSTGAGADGGEPG